MTNADPRIRQLNFKNLVHARETKECYNLLKQLSGCGGKGRVKKTGELDIRGTVVRVVKINGMDALYPQLDAWRKERNSLLHGLAESIQGIGPDIPAAEFLGRAIKTATEGFGKESRT